MPFREVNTWCQKDRYVRCTYDGFKATTLGHNTHNFFMIFMVKGLM